MLEAAAAKSGVYLRCYMQDTGGWLTPEVLGGSQDNGGPPTVRVIDDFIPPGRKRGHGE